METEKEKGERSNEVIIVIEEFHKNYHTAFVLNQYERSGFDVMIIANKKQKLFIARRSLNTQ